MKIPTHRSRLARRNPLAGWIVRVLAAVVLAAAGVMLAACGDSGPPTGTGPFATPDTSTLVGTWRGVVDGTFGRAVMTMRLSGDSTMTSEGDNPDYCKVTGSWTVAGSGFTAKGLECSGTTVTFVAPVTSLRLTGTWSALRGSGTFSVEKQ